MHGVTTKINHHISFTILTLLSLRRLRWCTFIHDPSPSSHLAPHSWAGTRKLKYSSQNQHCLFKCSDEVFPYKCIGQCPSPFNARNYWHVCLLFGQYRFTHEEISIRIHRAGHRLCPSTYMDAVLHWNCPHVTRIPAFSQLLIFTYVIWFMKA